MFKDDYPTRESFIKQVESSYESRDRVIRWTTGGMSGGSCWGDEPSPIEAEPEPDIEFLDKLLEEFCPEITFIQYRKMMRLDGLVVVTEGSDYEYYGNYSRYSEKTVNLGILYDAIVDITSK